MKHINSDILCYLSPKAKAAVDELVQKYKIDLDLAVSIVENMGTEQDIWEIPKDTTNE